MLGLPVKDVSDSHDVVEAVRRWLGREPGYLLILDSADDPALVRSYLPPKPKGHILLTSRAHNFALAYVWGGRDLRAVAPRSDSANFPGFFSILCSVFRDSVVTIFRVIS